MPAPKTEQELQRRSLVRDIRSRVRQRLLDVQDRALNEFEVNALAEFDAAVQRGEDYAAVAERIKTAPLVIRASLELE